MREATIKKIKGADKGIASGLMVLIIKEHGIMVSEKDKEYLFLEKSQLMTECGIKILDMEKASSLTKMVT